MTRKKPPLDIINMVLEDCIIAYPVSSFIISLYKRYQQYGTLSKKQLQGLYAKASEIPDIAPGKLAGVESIIKKMQTRDKSEPPAPTPLYEKDEPTKLLIDDILAKYPEHKRVLFLRSKFENNEPLSPTDLNDLNRFKQLLNK